MKSYGSIWDEDERFLQRRNKEYEKEAKMKSTLTNPAGMKRRKKKKNWFPKLKR